MPPTQSGITVSPALAEQWAKLSGDESGQIRALKIVIKDEQLDASSTIAPASDAVSDIDLLAEKGLLADDEAAYILFRLDSRGAPAEGSSEGLFEWLFWSYVPDHAKVREKMLYASTRATLQSQLGDQRFKESLFASSKSELSTAGYRSHVAHQASPAPLTAKEREMADIRAAEGRSVYTMADRRSHVHGNGGNGAQSGGGKEFGFKWDEDAQENVRQLAARLAGGDSSETSALTLTLDIPSETVKYHGSASQPKIPTDEPSYTFVVVDGQAVVYVYCCPSTSPIKSRMVAAASFHATSQKALKLGLRIDQKIETSTPEEITLGYLRQELGSSGLAGNDSAGGAPIPASDQGPKPAFAKPRRPGRK